MDTRTAAKTAFANGDFDKSLSLFSSLVRRTPYDDHLLLCDRAALLLRMGRPAEAERDARRAIAGSPDHVEAYYRQALALHDLGKFQEALDAAQPALSINPSETERETIEQLIGECSAKAAAAAAQVTVDHPQPPPLALVQTVAKAPHPRRPAADPWPTAGRFDDAESEAPTSMPQAARAPSRC